MVSIFQESNESEIIIMILAKLIEGTPLIKIINDNYNKHCTDVRNYILGDTP